MTHQTWISGKAIRPLFAEPVTFLERKGHPGMATETSKLSNEVVCLHCSVLQSTKQSTLDDFFQCVTIVL